MTAFWRPEVKLVTSTGTFSSLPRRQGAPRLVAVSVYFRGLNIVKQPSSVSFDSITGAIMCALLFLALLGGST